jgi:glycerol dehydrogenase
MAKVLSRIFAGPGKYIQGLGAIGDVGKHAKALGGRAYAIGGPTGISLVKDGLKTSLREESVELVGIDSTIKECTHEAIKRLSREAEGSADLIIGVGGGRAVDTAKAVAWTLRLPVIAVPTQCATNADVTGLSVVYTEKHEFVEYMFSPRHPDVVIVDTDIVGRAPFRFFVPGMGDALASKFEGEACKASNSLNLLGGLATDAGLALAHLCFDNFMKYGALAKQSIQIGAVTPAVEKIIESIKLLSGIAGETCGLAAAHAIHNGFTIMPGLKAEHGEIVAFATIVQMILECRPPEEIRHLTDWCLEIGLPTTLDDLGIGNITHEDLMRAADKACDPTDTMGNMPFPVTPKMTRDAILLADSIGGERRSSVLV